MLPQLTFVRHLDCLLSQTHGLQLVVERQEALALVLGAGDGLDVRHIQAVKECHEQIVKYNGRTIRTISYVIVT